jgi:hypothetical protein
MTEPRRPQAFFLDAFDAGGNGKIDLLIKDEFLINYKLISASYPHDENAFVKMIECVWISNRANPELFSSLRP